MSGTKKERPEEIFRRYGGQLRMSEAIAHGITRYILYALKDRASSSQSAEASTGCRNYLRSTTLM